ncbi:hypothetical protein F511_16422 [Dorcoceras hygrometricum]|uniref:Uncharacterized protein n=1 Tax=Dorcoceras hygrometricum TaxID=472368 RepID=A0A2Z7AMK7_9LAMI|nr:hypothetical protein F511_16422 [Dorcoceras hygrometricum]
MTSSQSADEQRSARSRISDDDISIAILITVDESVDTRYSRRLLMSNVEQEADTSKRNSEEGDVVLKESADGLAMMTSSLQAYRYHQLDNQTQATAHPVESFNEPAVAMHSVAQRYESSRSDEPAAKQLTIDEELSKLDVNC